MTHRTHEHMFVPAGPDIVRIVAILLRGHMRAPNAFGLRTSTPTPNLRERDFTCKWATFQSPYESLVCDPSHSPCNLWIRCHDGYMLNPSPFALPTVRELPQPRPTDSGGW